jgi:hypothetical protein
MTIKEIYEKLPESNYCSLNDMFTVCNSCVYIFPFLKRLDVDWHAVEKNLHYSAKYLTYKNDCFFICCKEDHPFVLLHHSKFSDSYYAYCTDIALYEDYFMPDIFKYAIRWNKCEFSASLDTDLKLF